MPWANSTRQDVVDFFKVAAEVPVKTSTELFELEQANDVMLRMKHSEINGAVVLGVQPQKEKE